MKLPPNTEMAYVAVLAPARQGSVAHRLRYYADEKRRKNPRMYGDYMVARPDCMTGEEAAEAGRFSELSALRAGQLDVEACEACYAREEESDHA